MRSFTIICFLFLQIFYACSGKDDKRNTSENDVDAARNFIRAALDGHYQEARQYVINDSLNSQYLDAAERNYEVRMNREEKRGYREASINMHDVRQINDSISIIIYSNSFKKENDSLKAIKKNGQWYIDLKYSFPRKDSIK